MMFSTPRQRNQRGESDTGLLIIIGVGILFLIFGIGASDLSSSSDDYTSSPTVDRIKDLTGARWAQITDGSNAFIIIPEGNRDGYYCILHFTGSDANTRVVKSSARCLDNSGLPAPAPFFG